MKQQILFILSTIILSSYGEEIVRNRRLLPFQVVKFPNDPCMVSGQSYNGTCYTKEECSNLGGTSSGSCANGYGVCCIMKIGCGDVTSQNGTYFEVTSSKLSAIKSGSCSGTVCRANDDICQIRLDFETFVLSGPSTITTSIGKCQFGEISAAGLDCSMATNCLTDTFSVSHAPNVPLVCGTLTGEHVYFDAIKDCHKLDMSLGAAAVGISTLATRDIKIKVSQIGCDDPDKAPSGCTQWYMSATGTIKSFNWAGSLHLANQQQVSCVRREEGKCKICWYTSQAADFAVSQYSTANIVTKDNFCCGYGTKGSGIVTAGLYDCLMIPGAIKGSSPNTVVAGAIQCAGGKQIRTKTATSSPVTTICSKVVPFRIEFFSDNYEYTATSTTTSTITTVSPSITSGTYTYEGKALTTNSKGFKIKYYQVAHNC